MWFCGRELSGYRFGSSNRNGISEMLIAMQFVVLPVVIERRNLIFSGVRKEELGYSRDQNFSRKCILKVRI